MPNDSTPRNSTRRHSIAIVGLGKIALDQHVPAIRGNPAFELVAVATPSGRPLDGVGGTFKDHREMLAALPDLEAVAICTPPGVRHAIARDVLLAGRHALLEKPPAASLNALDDLKGIADRRGRVLFATWHARFNPGVEAARAALAGQQVRRLQVTWKEDVRRWHPGQAWIWKAGGFGVFDPGINALSIVTRILEEPVFVAGADLFFPGNADAPIAAHLDLSTDRERAELRAEFDWRQTGDQTWTVEVESEAGTRLVLSNGGTRLSVDGRTVVDAPSAEYPAIYERFARLLDEGRSDVDEAPFRLVADAFMLGRRVTVEPFTE